MTTNNDFCDENEKKTNDYVKKSHNEQDLTELWKKGKLEEGKEYWVRLTNEWKNSIEQVYFNGEDFERFDIDDIEEVLAPVPSYEEWQGLNKDIDTITELWKNERSQLNEKIQLIGKLSVQAVDLKNEIKQLKELLKECRDEMNPYIELFTHKKTFKVLLTKIDEALK